MATITHATNSRESGFMSHACLSPTKWYHTPLNTDQICPFHLQKIQKALTNNPLITLIITHNPTSTPYKPSHSHTSRRRRRRGQANQISQPLELLPPLSSRSTRPRQWRIRIGSSRCSRWSSSPRRRQCARRRRRAPARSSRRGGRTRRARTCRASARRCTHVRRVQVVPVGGVRGGAGGRRRWVAWGWTHRRGMAGTQALVALKGARPRRRPPWRLQHHRLRRARRASTPSRSRPPTSPPTRAAAARSASTASCSSTRGWSPWTRCGRSAPPSPAARPTSTRSARPTSPQGQARPRRQQGRHGDLPASSRRPRPSPVAPPLFRQRQRRVVLRRADRRQERGDHRRRRVGAGARRGGVGGFLGDCMIKIIDSYVPTS